jgi:hypothetical protein
MSSVITPNGRLLVVAGNLVVEDTLTVRSNATFNQWIFADYGEITNDLLVGDSVITTNIDADVGTIDNLTVETLEATASVTTPDLFSDNITNTQNIQSATIEATTQFTGAELEINGPTRLTGDVTIDGSTTITGDFTLNGNNLEAIGADGERIEFYFGNEANIVQLYAANANIDNLFVETIESEDLEVANIEAEYANIATINVKDLTVTGNIEYDLYEYYEDYPVASTVYVATNGDDTRDGRSLVNAVATIERGVEIAANLLGSYHELEQTLGGPVLVSVYPGVYVSDGSIRVPDRCAIVSSGGQYATEVHASTSGRTNFANMFLLGSGCYLQGFAFRNQEIDDFDNPTGGFAVAFRPGAYFTRSCYIRDCSQVSNYTADKITAPLDPANGNPLVGKGGGVLLADRQLVSKNSIFPYMLGFGATPRSPNGIGYCAKNGAGINGIGSLGIFQRICFFALNGGQLTLNNSGTQFGDISMRSTGNMLVVSPEEVSSDVLLANVSAAESLTSSSTTLVDNMWTDLVNNGPEPDGSPNGTGNTSWLAGFEYNEAICQRDVGYIMNAIAYDLGADTTYNTITAAASYLRSGSDYVYSAQFEQTLSALDYLREETANLAISESSITTINELFDLMDDILELKTVPRATFGTSLTATTDETAAFEQLRNNKELIQDAVTDYISTTYPSLNYNVNTCKRDVGYVVDAISHDIYYGSNYGSCRSADAYWKEEPYGSLTYTFQGGAGEEPYTSDAYVQMQSIVSQVVQGTYPGQDLTASVATAAEATTLTGLLQIVIDSIDSGPNTIPNPPTYPNTALSPASADVSTITAAIPTLQTDTTSYIDTEYATYYEDKTKRDGGDFITSMAFDLKAGTYQVFKAYILGFFWHDAEYAFPAAQIPAYLHTWDYLGGEIQTLFGGALTDESIMVDAMVTALETTINTPVTLRYSSLLESLAHQFNNAGAGVNQYALPLNFRKPGFNRAVPYSVLQEDGGRVRWSGADELNNQYFAGGTRINGQTGKFEGRPFDISVRQIARRIANSRGSF